MTYEVLGVSCHGWCEQPSAAILDFNEGRCAGITAAARQQMQQPPAGGQQPGLCLLSGPLWLAVTDCSRQISSQLALLQQLTAWRSRSVLLVRCAAGCQHGFWRLLRQWISQQPKPCMHLTHGHCGVLSCATIFRNQSI